MGAATGTSVINDRQFQQMLGNKRLIQDLENRIKKAPRKLKKKLKRDLVEAEYTRFLDHLIFYNIL